jgi:hypothetical protein
MVHQVVHRLGQVSVGLLCALWFNDRIAYIARRDDDVGEYMCYVRKELVSLRRGLAVHYVSPSNPRVRYTRTIAGVPGDVVKEITSNGGDADDVLFPARNRVVPVGMVYVTSQCGTLEDSKTHGFVPLGLVEGIAIRSLF